MEELKDILSIIANLSIAIGAIVGILQLVKFVKSTKADHERRQKQSTIEFYRDIDKETYELERKMDESGILHGTRSINEVINDKSFKELIIRYLNLINRFSVGVITGVYDIVIFNQMSGQRITNMYNKLYPFILHRRNEIGRKTIYTDFEKMIKDIEKMNGNIYPNPGKIVNNP